MRKGWRILHWLIILVFITEIIYGFYMVFFVVGGTRYPLWRKAVETPVEVILKRRLYAIETWISVVGLTIYLGLTTFLPRKLNFIKDYLEEHSD
jgi:hypothetical protein